MNKCGLCLFFMFYVKLMEFDVFYFLWIIYIEYLVWGIFIVLFWIEMDNFCEGF